MNPQDRWLIAACLGTTIALCALSLWWSIAQWHECRDMGFSAFYCVKHVF